MSRVRRGAHRRRMLTYAADLRGRADAPRHLADGRARGVARLAHRPRTRPQPPRPRPARPRTRRARARPACWASRRRSRWPRWSAAWSPAASRCWPTRPTWCRTSGRWRSPSARSGSPGRPASSRMSFGYRRAEILAALANGVGLMVVADLDHASRRSSGSSSPTEVEGGVTLVIGLAGLAVNVAGATILWRSRGREPERAGRLPPRGRGPARLARRGARGRPGADARLDAGRPGHRDRDRRRWCC